MHFKKHVCVCVCAPLCRYEHEQHDLKYQTCDWSWGLLAGYNNEFMGVCVCSLCFCPSFGVVVRHIPQTSVKMLARRPASLGL